MPIRDYLSKMREKKASDIHFKESRPPSIRKPTGLELLETEPLSEKDILAILREILREEKVSQFLKDKIDVDFAYQDPEFGRFRANAYYQRDEISIALRFLPSEIPSFEELGLPKSIKKLALEPRGLVLVTGAAGSGKTTTLAAIIDYINNHLPWHIITIEDPLEILHKDKKAVIEQREVGVDVPSFACALKSVLRQDPNVVLIGEMRDRETVEAAIQVSEAGTLVFGTLHTMDVAETISRIVDFFPSETQNQFRLSLAATLKGVVSQRLITSSVNQQKVLVSELMIVDKLIQGYIRDKKDFEIRATVAQNRTEGMQTFDDCLMELFMKKEITIEDVERAAYNFHDLKIDMQKKGLTE
jgi:twitching motility protein PilT